MSVESPSYASSGLPADPFAELPAEWSEFPSAAEIAEFEAFMAEHGLLDTDEDREAYHLGHPGGHARTPHGPHPSPAGRARP